MVDDPVDLRSDTVTRPTAAMRRAMAEAPVGDDVYGEDPTVNELERRTAELLGKTRALFVPSGTMANQIALLVHTRPGDEVVIGEGAHLAWNESGAGAAWSGVQFAIAGAGGFFDPQQLEDAIKPPAVHLPRTSLLAVENTHNRAGGRVFPIDTLLRVTNYARERGLARHLDGARLWNAEVSTGVALPDWAAPFDTVSVCFSKGLGAPVGSAIAGSEEHIAAALRFRKMLGGGMRQAGVLAAAALYALDHHRQRLAIDHENAALLGRIVHERGGSGTRVRPVETNIVCIDLQGKTAAQVVARCREQGVLVGAAGPATVRAVTHLDVPPSSLTRAAEILAANCRLASEAP